jgi:hypothetical protein
MKERVSGIVQNMSTNPFQTFSRNKASNSSVFSFDISFVLVDEEGSSRHVWFKRSFRRPPKLEDGDHIEVVGRQGYFLGMLGRSNFYALRIIDKKRQREYTPWRNIVLDGRREKNGRASNPEVPGETATL